MVLTLDDCYSPPWLYKWAHAQLNEHMSGNLEMVLGWTSSRKSESGRLGRDHLVGLLDSRRDCASNKQAMVASGCHLPTYLVVRRALAAQELQIHCSTTPLLHHVRHILHRDTQGPKARFDQCSGAGRTSGVRSRTSSSQQAARGLFGCNQASRARWKEFLVQRPQSRWHVTVSRLSIFQRRESGLTL